MMRQRPAPCVSGDRIKLISMGPDEKDPIPSGATGTVVNVCSPFSDGTFNIDVDWDEGVGRSLGLVYPEDRFTVIK